MFVVTLALWIGGVHSSLECPVPVQRLYNIGERTTGLYTTSTSDCVSCSSGNVLISLPADSIASVYFNTSEALGVPVRLRLSYRSVATDTETPPETHQIQVLDIVTRHPSDSTCDTTVITGQWFWPRSAQTTVSFRSAAQHSVVFVSVDDSQSVCRLSEQFGLDSRFFLEYCPDQLIVLERIVRASITSPDTDTEFYGAIVAGGICLACVVFLVIWAITFSARSGLRRRT